MICKAHHVFDCILDYFDLECEDLDIFDADEHISKPCRACWAHVLRVACEYSWKEVCSELGYSQDAGARYIAKKLANGEYDHVRIFNGVTGLDHCRLIVQRLASRFEGVKCPAFQYGHCPLD